MANYPTQPRLVLWDIDHTLIETRGVGGELARAALEEVTGLRIDDVAEATGKTEPVILAETLRMHGIEPTATHQRAYGRALPQQYQRHADRLRTEGRVLPGASQALEALAKLPGFVQTILTGNYRAVAAIKLGTFGLDKYLDFEVGAYAEDHTDRAALVAVAQQRASKKYGHQFARNNTVIIGDTTHDVSAARTGGAAVIAVATGRDSANELRNAAADVVLADLTDTDRLIGVVLEATTTPLGQS
jgi:phosphoglycolate phosphatase-like HAD superfamily hydrolase